MKDIKGFDEQFKLGIEYCDSSVEWIPLEGIQNASLLYSQYRSMVRSMSLISLTLINSHGAVVKKYAVRSY